MKQNVANETSILAVFIINSVFLIFGITPLVN